MTRRDRQPSGSMNIGMCYVAAMIAASSGLSRVGVGSMSKCSTALSNHRVIPVSRAKLDPSQFRITGLDLTLDPPQFRITGEDLTTTVVLTILAGRAAPKTILW